MQIFLWLVALLFSCIASYFDYKTGEIPDTISIGLVAIALSIRLYFTLITSNILIFVDGLLSGAILFVFGAIIFYAGGWGGGDAKLIAGISSALGGLLITPAQGLEAIIPRFLLFLICIAFVCIPYSLIYSAIISVNNKNTKKLLHKWSQKAALFTLVSTIISIYIFTILPPARLSYIIAITIALLPLIVIFMKAVEKTALQKEIKVTALKEGDLVVEDIYINKHKIASRRDMDGLSKEAIKQIKTAAKLGKIKDTIKIRWGIKFAPVFPLALLLLPNLYKLLKFLFS